MAASLRDPTPVVVAVAVVVVVLCALPPCASGTPVPCEGGAVLDGFNATIRDNNLLMYHIGYLAYCQCLPGYVLYSACMARCRETGWLMLSEGCRPMTCLKPEFVAHSSIVNPKDEYDDGEVVQFQCDERYVPLGNSSLQLKCLFVGDHEVWRQMDAIYPQCVPDADCGTPPDVTDGFLVSVNTTRENGQAEYACADGAVMQGDGTVHCMLKSIDVIKNFDIRLVAWVYVPRCDRKCVIPDGIPGPQGVAIVQITKCTSTSFTHLLGRACDYPDVIRLRKGDFIRSIHDLLRS